MSLPMPQWKIDQLSQISSLSRSLLKKGVSRDELRAISKAEAGLSRFEHLDCCTDVMLQRLIGALEALLAFE